MDIPLVGITTFNQANRYGYPISALMHQYITAISQAGGASVMIPTCLSSALLLKVVDKVDGLLFTGGGDLAPALYQGEQHPNLMDVDSERDGMEIKLVKAAVTKRKPFLGICRGLQVINVAFGGTLYTHLPEQFAKGIKHDRDSGSERELLAHQVDIVADSRLGNILKIPHFPVNSLHHQGVAVLALGLNSTGRAPDGLVEALEVPDHPFGMAVQWHPEWLLSQPSTQRLFQAFIEAAGAQETR